MDPPDSNDQSADESLTEKVVNQIAKCEDIDPTDIETPLYNVVNVDALEELFRDREDGAERTGLLMFSYLGYEVVIKDREVHIQPLEEESSTNQTSDKK